MTNPTPKHQQEAREIARCTFHGDPLPTINGRMVASTSSNPEEALADYIDMALSARDTEIREVLEGLRMRAPDCWCDPYPVKEHGKPCLAARGLYEKLNSTTGK